MNDKSDDAYEKLVEQFLSAPQHGERMSVFWMDLVRYADTIGFHSDNPREVWPYRDWLIKSFNDNKRFDQFTREQIAGDLLPDATRETRVGSAYNRLLITTGEGGAQAKEYVKKYEADRVRNVSTVWMGATMGCAQCHDHKFDPYTAKDFYRMAAFFADIQEPAIRLPQPELELSTPQQEAEQKRLGTAIAGVQKILDTPTPELAAAQVEWETLKSFRGVVQGDVVRYAIPKPEPLAVELSAFRDAVLGVADDIVTMHEAAEVVRVAEAVSESAATGRTVGL